MANLSFEKRMIRVHPDMLGNHKSPEAFQLDARRLSEAEFRAFRERATEIKRRLMGDGVEEIEIAALFEGVLEGPIGELRIDDQPVTSMGQLYELAAQEYPVDGSVFEGLAGAVIAANLLAEQAAKNYARRRGGAGGTTAATTAATPPPSAADAAESSSSPAST